MSQFFVPLDSSDLMSTLHFQLSWEIGFCVVSFWKCCCECILSPLEEWSSAHTGKAGTILFLQQAMWGLGRPDSASSSAPRPHFTWRRKILVLPPLGAPLISPECQGPALRPGAPSDATASALVGHTGVTRGPHRGHLEPRSAQGTFERG